MIEVEYAGQGELDLAIELIQTTTGQNQLILPKAVVVQVHLMGPIWPAGRCQEKISGLHNVNYPNPLSNILKFSVGDSPAVFESLETL